MAKKKRKVRFLIFVILFILYTFVAAKPIPPEQGFQKRFAISVDRAIADSAQLDAEEASSGRYLPWTLGRYFGYTDFEGNFSLLRTRNQSSPEIVLSDSLWAEYNAAITEPDQSLSLKDIYGKEARTVENPRAYPLFIKNNLFLIDENYAKLSRLDAEGKTLWTFDFASPLTDIDYANGKTLAGCLNGSIQLLDEAGKRIFQFEPGGSRLSVILACRLSEDAGKIALVSGIDEQRFILMEQSGNTYRAGFSAYYGDGFRRPVHLEFTGEDQFVAFETESGLGVFNITERVMSMIPLAGRLLRLSSSDSATEGSNLALITREEGNLNQFILIKLPDTLMFKAPFKANEVFLAQKDQYYFVGGDTHLGSLALEEQ
ncbi:MAG: hypothetical protein LBM77_12685 [Spirochaetaceae bacterium]|jgi:hypothetical protein|nr:hypothetical protein [Spirochaetaceae bacterium]